MTRKVLSATIALEDTLSVQNVNGAGNLIVGYDEANTSSRIVCSIATDVNGNSLTTLGGANNTASGTNAGVSGGSSNTASTGGIRNESSGPFSHIAGGSQNVTTGVTQVLP